MSTAGGFSLYKEDYDGVLQLTVSEVITEGTGPNPKPTDSVTVNYKGTLMDGTVFDSSYDRKEPVTFVLNQVIPGWTEGVQLMKVGSKYKALPASTNACLSGSMCFLIDALTSSSVV